MNTVAIQPRGSIKINNRSSSCGPATAGTNTLTPCKECLNCKYHDNGNNTARLCSNGNANRFDHKYQAHTDGTRDVQLATTDSVDDDPLRNISSVAETCT